MKRCFRWRWAALLGLVGSCALLLPADDAYSVGMAQLMTEKSLPDATVAVIDPESGTSTGTGGSDVNIAIGDVILFRFSVGSIPDKRNRGMQTYLTEYVPPGTEVVGVRIIDANGVTIKPRYPGLAHDGCSGGSACSDFDDLPCTAGSARSGEATACSGNQRSFTGGTIAGAHGDTGIFFSNDAIVDRTPTDVFLSPTNGITMSPRPNGIDPDLTPMLGYESPYFAHNDWDYDQVQAYGTSSDVSGTGGNGNPPFLYGSPVAGPDTYYRYEATDTTGSGAIRFNDVVGPWRRIVYPGSKIGSERAVLPP